MRRIATCWRARLRRAWPSCMWCRACSARPTRSPHSSSDCVVTMCTWWCVWWGVWWGWCRTQHACLQHGGGGWRREGVGGSGSVSFGTVEGRRSSRCTADRLAACNEAHDRCEERCSCFQPETSTTPARAVRPCCGGACNTTIHNSSIHAAKSMQWRAVTPTISYPPPPALVPVPADQSTPDGQPSARSSLD